MTKRTSFNPLVIGVTLFFVLLLIAMIFIAPEQTQALLNQAKSGIFANFSWFYVLTFSVFLGFLLILSVSSLGNIKLGQDECSRPRILRNITVKSEKSEILAISHFKRLKIAKFGK
ncbi:hypothetical protein AO053_06585 [Haemophilus influenzae biotype aegyptius]|nr:hypothetical protein AO052_09770 [Haemophilus influenzae biotype aegyptius]TMQ37906.1 hypothetical protein AO053_06585 [Haemophilus influenzae biotype aegyptius]TMQ42302.1 hypothetical protein AO050_07410 [Haemophilus influenzae biotype aegyptius]